MQLKADGRGEGAAGPGPAGGVGGRRTVPRAASAWLRLHPGPLPRARLPYPVFSSSSFMPISRDISVVGVVLSESDRTHCQHVPVRLQRLYSVTRSCHLRDTPQSQPGAYAGSLLLKQLKAYLHLETKCLRKVLTQQVCCLLCPVAGCPWVSQQLGEDIGWELPGVPWDRYALGPVCPGAGVCLMGSLSLTEGGTPTKW